MPIVVEDDLNFGNGEDGDFMEFEPIDVTDNEEDNDDG